MKLLKIMVLVSILFTMFLFNPIYCENLQADFIRATVFGYDNKIIIDKDLIVIPISATNPVLIYRDMNITIYGNVSTDGDNIYISINNRQINLTIDKFIDLLDRAIKQNFSLEREFKFKNRESEKFIEVYEKHIVLRNRAKVRAYILGIFAINTTIEEEIIIYFDGKIQRNIKRPFWWFLVTNVS